MSGIGKHCGTGLFCVWVSLCLSSGLAAATWTVGPGGDFASIQPALDAAADGDTVLVSPGEYVIDEPIDFNRGRDPEAPVPRPVKNLVLRSTEE